VVARRENARVGKGNPAARGGRVADVTEARRDVTAGAWLCGAALPVFESGLGRRRGGGREREKRRVGSGRETRGRTGWIHGGVSWTRRGCGWRDGIPIEFVRVRDTTRVACMT
jgi:hypothetical protein